MKKKTIINLVLAVFALGMAGVCAWSIISEKIFESDLKEREDLVKARLRQVKDAEDAFRRVNKHLCGDIDSLVDFVKTERSFKETNASRDLTQDEYEKIAEEIGASGNYTEDEIKRMVPEKAVEKGIITIDTIWESVSDMLGISNADSLKLLPVGRPGATISLRKREVLDYRTGETTSLVEFRANLEDYLDGMEQKRIDNYRSDLVRKGGLKQGLWADVDSVDHDKDDWIGLRMGDLMDASNKMSGNWSN